jgi:ribosome biogenesis GTPase / thiamine phosphate phosphatase
LNRPILTGTTAATGTGRVLASFGRSALIESQGEVLHCALWGRRLRIVCGDQVQWRRHSADGAPIVESMHARRNVFQRIDNRGRPEAIAANVDRLVIVIAPEPKPDWFIVDRFWAGAVIAEIPALLIVNKRDLDRNPIAADLADYERLGLKPRVVSSRSADDMMALREKLAAGTSLIVGQSGVGKSSLINALIPDAAAQTAELTRDLEGKHTTTTSRCYLLPAVDASAAPLRAPGALIDAPGVRDFAPPASIARAAESGFIEIHARRGDCKFNDCRHFDEPGCAVRAGVSDASISTRRYESYRRLLRLFESLKPP